MGLFSQSGYVGYWKDRVAQAQDGTKVAGAEVQEGFLDRLEIQAGQRVLDLGCSYGRLFPLLAARGAQVWGADVDPEALKEAAAQGYQQLDVGAAEKTPYEADFFDQVIAWGVYDVVEQEEGLVEANRILKTGGRFLFTGKHHDYSPNDRLGFIAERNACLKDFPNHFTDLRSLAQLLPQYGFRWVAGFGFEQRGDFGKGEFFELDLKEAKPFYEFLLVLEKTETLAPQGLTFCGPHSQTALSKAAHSGYQDLRQFFKEHKAQNGDE
ncbi:MAG: class I SAM-dependent methyltransferase [bacterium]|nr:class I SAM-dependent methyltransferase [bacterium]